MKALSRSLLVVAAIALSGCGEEKQPEILTVSARENRDLIEILVTGIDKPITVNSVTINNDYCQSGLKLTLSERQRMLNSGRFNSKQKVGFPFTVNAGETRIIQTKAYNCQLQKVDISTTEGDFSWNW